MGQVAHAVVSEKYSVSALKQRLNGLLNKNITVKSAVKVPESFHARYSARSRHYRYLISTERISMYNEYTCVYTFPLNIRLIRKLIPLFLGSHDFINFCTLPEKGTTLCRITDFSLGKKGNILEFNIRANRFLHKMVRMIVGALLEAGRAKIPADTVRQSLENKKGPRIGACARPCGLTLIEVAY
jgi:tRNA pseudouridine38-40 synthase